eukprot:scaffold32493_cov59-Attheya_sp.AAC.9
MTEEEEGIRKEEDVLFSKLAEPPTVLAGIMDILGDDKLTEELTEQRNVSKQRKRTNDMRKSEASRKRLQNMSPGESGENKRARGRPRKTPLVSKEVQK